MAFYFCKYIYNTQAFTCSIETDQSINTQESFAEFVKHIAKIQKTKIDDIRIDTITRLD